jgi:hypothetical protein
MPDRPEDSFAFAELLNAEIPGPDLRSQLEILMETGRLGEYHFNFFADSTDLTSEHPLLATVDGFIARWDGTRWVAD